MVRKLRLFSVPAEKRFEIGPIAYDALRRATRCAARAALPVAVLVHASSALAQSEDFAVQRFDPAPGPHNYFTTRGARTDGKMVWSVGLVANYSFRPFDVRTCIGPVGATCDGPGVENGSIKTLKLVENEITGNALATLTPFPRLQLGLDVPVSWVKGQGVASSTNTSGMAGISSVGVGDPLLEAKVRVAGAVNDPFVVGLAGFVTAPLGHATAKDEYVGDKLPSGGGRLILDGDKGPLSVGANLAGVFRDKAHIGTSTVGPEGRYSVAVGFRVSPLVRILADAFGTTRFSSTQGENTLELDGGFQITPLSSPLSISVGAGTGLVQGVGVPKVRGFLGLIYALEKRDRDEDGIDDSVDQCPTDKEDVDGYEDSDGCPDPDNDLDTVLDSVDKCPDQPEDQDNFEDRDGCPDPDNDKDGIPDVSDQCPNEPETKNGYKDDDGCPDEADRDNDGVPDARDKCPDAAEDTDGFQDTDGCPDLDNDNDGIPDAQDECIDEPETKNKFEDEDGCPDDPKAASKKTK